PCVYEGSETNLSNALSGDALSVAKWPGIPSVAFVLFNVSTPTHGSFAIVRSTATDATHAGPRTPNETRTRHSEFIEPSTSARPNATSLRFAGSLRTAIESARRRCVAALDKVAKHQKVALD